jgi:hypothetical protein
MKKKWKKGLSGGNDCLYDFSLNVFHYLLSGASALAAGPYGHGHGGHMGPRGGFGHPQMMMGPHHGEGFSWLPLLTFFI